MITLTDYQGKDALPKKQHRNFHYDAAFLPGCILFMENGILIKCHRTKIDMDDFISNR